MSSDSDILLAINSVLQNYTTKVESATGRTTWIKVMTENRMKALEDIENKLKTLRVRYNITKTNKSSFSAIEFSLKSGGKEYIYFKNLKGGGSGAGAALTKLSESSQALYAALAFHAKGGKIDSSDLSPSNFNIAKNHTDTDESFNSMVNNLPEDWIKSCIVGANKLYEVYGNNGRYTFHRGSRLVDQIEKYAWSIIKSEGAFGNLNKWSPADIYMVRNDFDISTLLSEKTLKGLNNAMYENIKDGKLIGVSLKKITGNSAKFSKKNFPDDRKILDIKWIKNEVNETAMDVYLHFSGGKVQFRSFGGDVSLSGWQGEVKGASANQGKISLGPLNYILKRHGVSELPTSNESARLAVDNSERHASEMSDLFKKLKVTNEDLTNFIMMQSPKYRYSKYLGLKLLDTIETMSSDKKDAVMEDIYLYASSQASYSAPYTKIE